MSYSIKIERVPYEEPHHVELRWTVSNGNTSTNFKYYDNASNLEKIAKHLEEFPRHNSDVFLFEIGSERPEDRFAYYFRFRVFLTKSTGDTALLIRFNNNRILPDREITEFCIQTKPAAINNLGQLFRKYSKLEDEILFWSDEHTYVGSD